MLLSSVLAAHPVRRREARFLAEPHQTQERVLRDLLRAAAPTEWGRRYGFLEMARARDPVAAFRARVPLLDYSAFRADVERMRRGGIDIAWPGRIRHFAVSSGTVAAGKLLPVSGRAGRASREFGLLAALSYTASVGSARWMGGRLLSVPGRAERDPEHPANLVGEMSGLMLLFAPWFVTRLMQCVPRRVLFLPRWEDKLRQIAERTHALDVRAIAMVPSWAAVLFPLVIERHNAATGRRAVTVREVWPNLRVMFTGAVPLSSYEALLREQIGGGIDFVESYGASEGVFAYRRDPAHHDMHLHLDSGVYYEFTRMDGAGPSRIGLADVEVGVRYRMHVSTCSGLWAYGIGDVVRFTSLEPHRIVVSGRTAEMLDRFGEAVFAEEARQALERACRDTGAFVRDYHVACMGPARGRMPRHQWLVEFAGATPDLARFAGTIDAHLQAVNRHYGTRRECGAFGAPEVVPLPVDTFRRWLHATRERVDAQSKVPRMSEDRRIADGVLLEAETINNSSS